MTKQKEFILPTEEDTISLAQKIARIAQKGDIFALSGTLGMGKSVFARAFVQELCGVQDVPSPTFTLLQTYQTDGFDVYHFDLYRLKYPDEIFELGIEDAIYNGVCLIEWPEKMGGYLPKDVFKVNIIPDSGGRKIVIQTISEDKFFRLSSIGDF